MSSSQFDESVVRETDVEVEAPVESGSDVAWERTGSEHEIDQPSSPSSSGYAGEGGSTSATSASSLIEIQRDEIEEQMRIHIDEISISDSNASWIPGKRHQDEVRTLIFSLN